MADDDKTVETFELDAEIFSAGVWNGDKYTTEDLDAMVSAFTALGDEVKPPVKLGHRPSIKAEPREDGQPALGWVSSLKREGEKLIAHLTELPEVVYQAIKKKRYKRVSSEIFWNYTSGAEKFKRVLGGVALLGADMPAVRNLKDLEALFGQAPEGSGSFDLCKVYTAEVNESGEIENRSKDMSDEIKKEYEDRLGVEKTARLAAEEKLKEYTEAEAKRVEADATGKFKAYVDGLVESGKVTPAAAEVLISKRVYSNGTVLVDFDALKVFMDTLSKTLDTEESGTGNGDKAKKSYTDAGVEVDRLTREYIAKHDRVTYVDAMQIVLKAPENKNLADEYSSK